MYPTSSIGIRKWRGALLNTNHHIRKSEFAQNSVALEFPWLNDSGSAIKDLSDQ
jgi:hypothetical protein